MDRLDIDLPASLGEWVDRQVGSASYSDRGDYVRDLIRRDRERAERIAELQRLVTEGLDSGPGTTSREELRAAGRMAVTTSAVPF